ncbi:MAG: hypothetical protein WDN08_16080 [Rhizomicrobium sp.]
MPVSSKVSRNRGQRQAARPRRAAAERRARRHVGAQFRRDRDAHVAGIDAPAGKHVFVGHERHVAVAPAHQHARRAAVALHQHQRRRILGTQRLFDDFLVVGIEDGHGWKFRGVHLSESNLQPSP